MGVKKDMGPEDPLSAVLTSLQSAPTPPPTMVYQHTDVMWLII